MDHFLIPPEPKLHHLLVDVGDHVDGHFFMGWDAGHLDLVAEERDTAICVHLSRLTQAEDVLGRGIGPGQEEGAKEAIPLGDGLVEA